MTTGNLYNGNGQRIRLTWNGSLYQKYYYMGSALFFTTDANNLRDSENILSPGGSIVASRRQDSSDANKYYFYHTDIRGSVTNIVGTKENAIYLAQGYNYDNFGKEEELKSESSFKNDVTFTGAVSDSMTGLYYMNARHYDPDTGRFLQQDTYKGSAAVPWTQHLYAYTGNNPVNMVDPMGHYTNTASDQYANYTYDWSSKTLVPIVNYSNTMTDQYQGDYGRTTSTISKNGIQKKAVNLPKSKPRSVNDASNQYVEPGMGGAYSSQRFESTQSATYLVTKVPYIGQVDSGYMGANCYAYALKLMNDPSNGGQPFGDPPGPGYFSDNPISRAELLSSSNPKALIETRMQADFDVLGYSMYAKSANMITPSGNNWIIAAAYDPQGGDIHFYRLDGNQWSHKPGASGAIQQTDFYDQPLMDPGNSYRREYTEFIGYYEIGLR